METNDTVKQAEAPKFTDVQIILQYIFGGKSTFTLQSVASGERFTYQIVQSAKRAGDSRPPVFFVTVLTGPDNSSDYAFVGTIFERKTYKFSPKAGFTLQSPSVRAFQWAFAQFVAGVVPEKLEFWPTTNCARCGRPLTVPTSVHNGFGPDCITKVGVGMGNQPITNKQQASTIREMVSAAGGTQNPLSADLRTYIINKTDSYKVGHVQVAPVVNPNAPSDADVRRMVAAKRGEPENFTMDGEMTQQEAENFWFKRYKKQPLTPAELTEMEAR